jgi:chemosensory pili system protein ChpA (sensor histidine kinase/response regulator)
MGRKIVVIDDDPCIRELVALHLGDVGYKVLAAEDAVAGGYLILREMPDLVVCDVEMPYLNGYDFVAALKTHPSTKDIPIVFLTVRDDVDEHAAKLGAAAYLRKPLTKDRLLDIVSLYADVDAE